MPLDVTRLATHQAEFESEFTALLRWEQRENSDIVAKTQKIIDSVRTEGDAALVRFTCEFDRRSIQAASELPIDQAALAAAWQRLPTTDRDNLQVAAARIEAYHRKQQIAEPEFTDEYDNRLGIRATPIERVGVYVPGGQASYPSTVLMTLIPAKVAGVHETVVVVPMPDDEVSDHVFAALHLVEPTAVYGIGGAQAIAALAYGTETIPKVDKIVGPGGDWVAAAKKLVFGPVGIESIAGPSEILVIADGTVDPNWTAWDLMSQAEHDASAQAILLSPSANYLDTVAACITTNLANSPRAAIIRQSLARRGALIQTRSIDEAIELANRVAPEHLQLAVANPRQYVDAIKHTGAIFLGQFSGEALGDYVAGPSHVLPTFGTARYASVLSVHDFIKRTSIIDISVDGAQVLGRVASGIAEIEGLFAHGEAAKARVRDYDDNA
ncbi:MAG: histidinol dehydrogenase [Gammaproteobacteria bacterium]|nr:histidinol dehydrogenase [Gammaproteobacteria bacterium]